MGYVCPVCEDPQADGHHLANHLAFTAMLGDDAHERWLDEHAPDWADADPAALADTVVGHADETDFPQVFEDTTEDDRGARGHGNGGAQGHGHGARGHGHGNDHAGASPVGDPDGVAPDVTTDPSALFDDDVDSDAVLAEARELTRQRRANAGEGKDDGDDSTPDGDADGATDDGDADGATGDGD